MVERCGEYVSLCRPVHPVWFPPRPRREVEACDAPAREPLPAPAACPLPPEPAVRVPFASYLERQNLEDRVELSPEMARPADLTRRPQAAGMPAPSDRARSEPNTNAPARLSDVLPVAPTPRRVEVETAYRLRVATTRPSGVLDVMG